MAEVLLCSKGKGKSRRDAVNSEVRRQTFEAMRCFECLLFRYPCSGISSVRLADGVYIPNFPSTRWKIHPYGVAHLPTNFLRSGGRAVSVEPSLPRWCGWVDPLTLVPGGVRELYRALGLGVK